MGYNTTIVILNDYLHEINKDSEFGQAVYQAAAKHWTSDKPVSFEYGSQIIAQHHADTISINMVGQNVGQCLGFQHTAYAFKNDNEVKLFALKEIARTLGYKLIKMSERERAHYDLKPYAGSGCIL